MLSPPGRRRNHLTRLYPEGGNRHLVTIDADVAVQHHLPRFLTRRGETKTVHDVIQSRLQQLQQPNAGDPLGLRRLPEVRLELCLQHPVDAAQLLLLPQADTELRGLAPALRMHPRRHRPFVHGALLRVAFLALKVQLHALAAAQPAHRTCVTSHLHPPPLRRPASVVRNRGHIADQVDLHPRRLERPDGRLAAGTRPLHVYLHLLHAMLDCLAGRRFGGQPCRKGRALAGALEPRGAGAGPGQHVPLGISDRHDRVVERGLNVRHARGHIPPFLLSPLTLGHFSSSTTMLCDRATTRLPDCASAISFPAAASLTPRSSWDPFECAHWSGCAGRAPADSSCGATPGRTQSRSDGGYPGRYPGGDLLRLCSYGRCSRAAAWSPPRSSHGPACPD